MQRGEDPVEEPNTEKELKCVNGTLELKGTYQVHSNQGYHLLSGCHRVIAEDAELELFAPLIFESTSLEFDGHLTVVAKAPMAGSCLTVWGQVVISGDFFMKDCHYGGGITALNMIQKRGKISIENCSSKSRGGAIYVEDSFNQEGGEMMIQHCHAGDYGGGVCAWKNITQNNGALRVEDCSARLHGGALRAERSFRQTGGNVSLSNCRALDGDGGGLLARDFEQLAGAMRIQSCKAGVFGGGLSIFWGKIFRQDGELHVRTCSARDGGALHLHSSAKIQQGESATASVEARQLKEKCLSQIGGATHTHNLPHKTHTAAVYLRESCELVTSGDDYFKKGC